MPSTTADDGPLRLELVLPHLDWKPADTITGSAILSFAGNAPTMLSGSGGGLIVFDYHEVGGNRYVDGVMTADCRPYPLDPATPINVSLFKSGAASGSEPDADFLRSFFADPQIHLPVGTWDVTAVATFYDGPGCSGRTHRMTATVRIAVAG